MDNFLLQHQAADAYVAVATPPGRSGVAVIRLAGADAPRIADRVFRFGPLPDVRPVEPPQEPVPDRTVVGMKGYTAALGYLLDPHEQTIIDQAVLLRFRAPHSYTGEEVVEISVHGGSEVTRSAVRALCLAGARPAQAGEFTRNAFLNGKMDLAQAEAVIELIDSETARAARAALLQLQGGLSEQIHAVLDALYELMSALEMSIEYPDHEDSRLDESYLRRVLERAIRQLDQLKQSYRQGEILRAGLQVVLIGPPNVGKSSLLNRLSGQERSIVTHIPGTTRDTIELDMDLDGIPVHLTDTAGIRESSDPIEQMGIERTRKAMEAADLLIWMIAPPIQGEPAAASEVFSLPPDKPLLIVANKDDLPDFSGFMEHFQENVLSQMTFSSTQTAAWDIHQAARGCSEPFQPLPVSARDGSGLEVLTEVIVALYEAWGTQAAEQSVLTSARHYDAVVKALELLQQVAADLVYLPQDVLAQALRGAAEMLALIIGEQVSEEVINQIFERFCVGK